MCRTKHSITPRPPRSAHVIHSLAGPGCARHAPEGRGAWLKKLPHADLRAQFELLYASMEQAVQTQRDTRKLMVRLGKPFPEIKRLATAPGLGVVGTHVFATTTAC